MALSTYQHEFVTFLVRSGALSFGEFTLKSGRKAPYYVNTGNFNDGNKIATLGSFYAQHIIAHGLVREPAENTVIFGPAYKGIPLCVATAAALFEHHHRNVGFSFDRKEAKDHGDGGMIVGRRLSGGENVIVVEDVITAGTTLRKVVPLLAGLGIPKLGGVVIAVDRQERGEGAKSALQEAQDSLGISIYPIVTIRQIIELLSTENSSGIVLPSAQRDQAYAYLEQYGA